jgi:TonB family protein
MLMCSSSLYAQNTDTTFFNAYWERTTKAEAMYYRLPIVKEGNAYRFSDYYINGTKQMEGYSLSATEEILTGKCIYYDNGIKSEEGTYDNHVRNGEWIRYVPYIDNEIVWYKETYVSGVRKGEFTSYYENGKVKSKEVYTDTGATGKRFNEKGDEIEFIPFFIMPKFNGDFYSYLSKNIHYPDYCIKKNIEGKVLISFLINENGDVFNARVIKSIHPLLDDEALRLITTMPKWIPGKVDGQPDKITLTQPITFALTD